MDTQMTIVKSDNKRNSKTDSQMTIVDNQSPRQDENKEPRNNRGDSLNKSSAKTTESRKNKKNRRDKENDRVPDIGLSGDDSAITVPTMTVSSVMSSKEQGNKGKKLTPSNKKKKGERFVGEGTVGSSTTGK